MSFQLFKNKYTLWAKLLEGNYRVVSKQKAPLSVPDSARRRLFSLVSGYHGCISQEAFGCKWQKPTPEQKGNVRADVWASELKERYRARLENGVRTKAKIHTPAHTHCRAAICSMSLVSMDLSPS